MPLIETDTALADCKTDPPGGVTDLSAGSPATKQEAILAQRGAFDFLSLSLFSDKAACIPLLKAQHAELLALFEAVRATMDVPARSTAERALAARNLMSGLATNLASHFSIEHSRLHKVMAKDHRNRGLSSQFEREAENLRGSLSGFFRQYGAPSAILEDPAGFMDALAKNCRLTTTRFKDEELELFPSHERTSHSG